MIEKAKKTMNCKWIWMIFSILLVLQVAWSAWAFERYNPSTNYCGPKLEAYHKTLPNPVPNKPIPGVNFNTACYEHDKCYGMCSSNCASKSMCDKDFKNRMEQICKPKSTALRKACMELAQTYYTAVDQAGAISYKCGVPACPDSTKTQPMGTPDAEKAFFFEHENFAGASVEWSKGSEISDLTKWNTPTGAKWNDRISSVKVGSGVRVLIYEHTNFKGRCMTLSNGRDYPYMTSLNANLSGKETWIARISSLKVVDPPQKCPGAFHLDNPAGPRRILIVSEDRLDRLNEPYSRPHKLGA
jgi:hypothetical protein